MRSTFKWLPVGMAVVITAGLVFAQGLPPNKTGPWKTVNGVAVLNTGSSLIDAAGTGTRCIGLADNQDGPHFCWDAIHAGGTMDASYSGSFGGVTLINGTIVAGSSEWTISSTFLNALASAVTVGGHKVGAGQALILTSVTYYVSGAASGAGNTVFRASDGTNTCDFTSSCTTNDNTTGVKRVDGTGTAGTGCSFAAGAAITLSIQSTSCATTKPTIKNIDWVGTGA
jgi:hypothetical protein